MVDADPREPAILRAAQYLRMSTEHQNYSLEHQAAAISAYAARRGLDVVRTYADAGISGVQLDRRDGLKQLLADVLGGQADYSVVLAYDVSRWGRFQDPDESAHYEFICKASGVRVEYCAELFDNDGSLAATLIKHLKRAMAGEYSRELSVKVADAQRRLAGKGFWQGGPPGFGLRRQLIDRSGLRGAILEQGEWKAVMGARVVLTPGPPAEIAVVRRIFRMFLVQGLAPTSVARRLNAAGTPAEFGQPWSQRRVRQVLTNEKYIGVQVFGKSVNRLSGVRRREPPSAWQRAEGALRPIVAREIFELTQRNLAEQFNYMSETEMLSGLSELLAQHGRLSTTLINAAKHLPCPEMYRRRFGGLVGAYARIGYAASERALHASQATRRQPGAPAPKRRGSLPPEEMVERLKDLYAQAGHLSIRLIKQSPDVPGIQAYRRMFGDLATIYAQVGYAPTLKQKQGMVAMTARFADGALVRRTRSDN